MVSGSEPWTFGWLKACCHFLLSMRFLQCGEFLKYLAWMQPRLGKQHNYFKKSLHCWKCMLKWYVAIQLKAYLISIISNFVPKFSLICMNPIWALKPSCKTPFQHVLTTLRCVFEVLTLVGQNEPSYELSKCKT